MRRPLLALVLLLATACAKERPNVLLITFDTTRADRIGFAGGRAGVTPNLDALAQSGTAFTTAIASQPLTAPSHATILTGLYPYHHGVRNNGAYTLAPERVSLAERLHDAGYATHGIVASYVLDSRFGFDQGFDSFDDDLTAGTSLGAGQRELDAKHVADKALAWLSRLDDEKREKKPFFLWLHFYDPHARYAPPAEIAAKFPNDPYAGEIHYADRELGRVLAALRERKVLDDTLVVFTADHGESLGEHGEEGHGLFVYDATTRVPLLFAGPKVPAGKRHDWIASHVDIVPTLAAILGLDAPKLDGSSLAQWWDGAAPPDRRAYSETFAARMNFGWSELRALRTRAAHVIEAPKREAYDVAADRAERRNLYGGALPNGARPLFAELARLRTSDDFRAHGSSGVDDETRRKLAALGYIMSTTNDASAAAIDPKDRVATWEAFHRAQLRLRQRQYAEAVSELRAIAVTEPASDAVASLLTSALHEQGKIAEALDELKRRIERDPANPRPYVERAVLLRGAGELAEARSLAEAALRLDPNDADAAIALADVDMAEGKYGEAEQRLRAALQRNPRSSIVIAALGNCLNRAGRAAEALQVLERGHRNDPNSHVLAYDYGVVLERAGRTREAALAYRAALRLDPEHSMTWNNLGSMLDRAGKRKEAIAMFARARRLDPRNVEATYNLGALLLETGRAREAVPLLADAASRRPDLVIAKIRLAAALEAAGQPERALAVWRAAAAQHPRAWAKVALLELRAGRLEASRAAVEQGRKLVGPPFNEVWSQVMRGSSSVDSQSTRR